MGVGKSAVGRRIAEATGRTFEDTDLLLERRFGRAVHQIFSVYGEAAFRDHELSILKSLQPGNFVVSTGGGIVLREDNWSELNRLGIVVYLEASAETLISHLANSKKKRPLLATENWEDRVREILSNRQELYRKADIRVQVDTEADISAIAERTLSALGWQPDAH